MVYPNNDEVYHTDVVYEKICKYIKIMVIVIFNNNIAEKQQKTRISSKKSYEKLTFLDL